MTPTRCAALRWACWHPHREAARPGPGSRGQRRRRAIRRQGQGRRPGRAGAGLRVRPPARVTRTKAWTWPYQSVRARQARR
ncbi:hypothetical protein ACPA9J_24525 [Pseudomonas aeruginosa]